MIKINIDLFCTSALPTTPLPLCPNGEKIKQIFVCMHQSGPFPRDFQITLLIYN